MRPFVKSVWGLSFVILAVACSSTKQPDGGIDAQGLSATGGTSASGGTSGGSGGGDGLGGGTSSVAGAGGGGGTTGGSAGGGASMGGRTGSGGTTAGRDASVPIGAGGAGDFVSHVMPVFCRNIVAMGLSPSAEACETDFFNPNWMGVDEIAQAIAAGRIVWDAVKADDCLSAVAVTPAPSQPPAVCNEMLTPTVPSGAACVRDEECVDGRCHKSSCGSSCCAGVCGRPLAVGAACRSAASCADTDDCVHRPAVSSEPTCQPRPGKGQPCASGDFCQDGLVCDSAGSKTCVSYPKEGEACTPNGIECENGMFCDSSSLKCRPRIPVGGACTVPDGGAARPEAGCILWAACIGGVCVGLPGKGGACTLLDGGYPLYGCRAGTCIDGTCQMIYQPCTLDRAGTPDAGARD